MLLFRWLLHVPFLYWGVVWADEIKSSAKGRLEVQTAKKKSSKVRIGEKLKVEISEKKIER